MPTHSFSLAQLQLWDDASSICATKIIRNYSSSFSLGVRLLPRQVRKDISHLYAVVRIADEIVDGAAQQAGYGVAQIRSMLDDYEQQVLTAPEHRFITDPVLHSYADTARRCGFPDSLIRAFFHSMRQDIQEGLHKFDARERDEYIYGSAEVIGLLCLRVFLAHEHLKTGTAPDRSAQETEILNNGAKALGAAFQKINFMRDAGADSTQLGRWYFPELHHDTDPQEAITRLITDIEHNISTARSSIPYLPRDCQPAVIAITDLFQELLEQISRTSSSDLLGKRIRISNPRKLAITAKSLTGWGYQRIIQGK